MPAESATLPELPAGIYRHYKGHLYLALGYAHDANYDGRVAVHYVALDTPGSKSGPRLAARTAVSNDPYIDAWWDFVHADGTKCAESDGRGHCSKHLATKPRFQYLGPSLPAPGV